MKKYIKAGLLLLLAVAPVILIFILISGENVQPEYDFDNDYVLEDIGDNAEINHGDTNIDAEIMDTSQVTTLRLGGMFIPFSISSEVDFFNMTNELYNIEIVETFNWTWVSDSTVIMETHTGETITITTTGAEADDDAGWQDSLWRAMRESSEELLREGDFDIIVTSSDFLLDFWDSSISWVDLYALIDADPLLSRTDFFPNVLHAGEAPDGTLPLFTPGFIISTMISMQGAAEQVMPLTIENLHNHLLEQDTQKFTTSDSHLASIMSLIIWSSENHFVDIERGIANFNSDDFISTLELLHHVSPHPSTEFAWWEADEEAQEAHFEELMRYRESEVERFERGEILLYPFTMSDPMQFHVMKTALDGVIATGVPSIEGGNHIILTNEQIGINADSPHQDAAWNFLRRLMSYSPAYITPRHSLPTRIDMFEASMERVTRPAFHGGAEYPRTREWRGPTGWLAPVRLRVYAMTAAEVEVFREIITTAIAPRPIPIEIQMILLEETERFIYQNRTAEETASIIQTRVQDFLDSR